MAPPPPKLVLAEAEGAPKAEAPTENEFFPEGDLNPARRAFLLGKFREATVRHDDAAREILLVSLLRNYIHHKEYSEADLLVEHTADSLTQRWRSNNMAARYNFYVGRIRAVQLRYAEAAECFTQSLRKAPEGAVGFKTVVTKYQVVVQLLTGEVPVRSTFVQDDGDTSLKPYLHLASAVRFGQVNGYESVLKKYEKVYKRDLTLTLVRRIHQVVVKSALRRIMLAYTRIALPDVAALLHLDDPSDVGHIVRKAIKEGVIDASVSDLILTSNVVADVYSTPEPSLQYQRRVEFANKMHTQALMAMRFMPTEESNEDEEEQKEEERKQRAEDEAAVEELLEEEMEE